LLPQERVIINPTTELLKAGVGSVYLEDDDYLPTMVEEHNRAISLPMLQHFALGAQMLLESLPTGVEQDRQILSKLQASGPPSTGTELDVLNAIEYRITFKSAVEIALLTASRLIQQIDSANGERGGEL